MSFLRSSLLIAIVSLGVLLGYGTDLFGDCCAHHEPTQAQHEQSAPLEKAPVQGDDCQCLCHEVISPVVIEPVPVAALLVATAFVSHADEFPPDAVPLGIEYPPQLA